MAFETKLKPQYSNQKSFYGKARVENEDGKKVLYSYNTKVAEIVDGKARVFGLYSNTSNRHIKEFLKQNGFKVDNSKQIMKDYGGENKGDLFKTSQDADEDRVRTAKDDSYSMEKIDESSISSTAEGAKVFKINNHMEIVAESEKTRNGFRHVAKLFVDGREVDSSKANYLNRTWESYDFESVVNNLIEKTSYVAPEQKKELESKFQQISHEKIESSFRTIGNVASLGEIFADNEKDKNTWKLRMIKAGLGESFQLPDDWESLSEKEKGKRLDLVIKTLKKEE